MTNQPAYRQRLSAGDKINKAPGWRGPISFGSARPVNGEKRVRAIMECKDYDPQLFKAGTRKFIIRRIERTAPTKPQAHEAMIAFCKELDTRFPGGNAAAHHKSITVAQALDLMMNLQVRGVKRKRTIESYETSISPIIKRLGDTRLDDLDAMQIKAALWEPQRRRAEKRLDLLSRAIECARKNNAFPEHASNPVEAVPSVWDATGVDEADLIKIERGAIPDSEITDLFKVVADKPKWLALLYIAAFAGPRCNELLEMPRWAYNPQRGTLKVGKAKTASSTGREIVLGPQGKTLIENLLKDHEAHGYEGEWLFPAELGGMYTHTNFCKAFKPLMFAAGLATKQIGKDGETARYDRDRKRVKDREYILPRWTMHDFRHTVSVRDRDLVPPIYLDAQIGHKNAQRAFDRNAIENPYTKSQAKSETFFEARQRFAALVDERVRKLLPTDEEGSAQGRADKAWGIDKGAAA